MRPYPAITVLAALAGLARAADSPRITTIPAIARDGTVSGAGRVHGTVTYFDPSRRCLCLQDGEVGLFVHVPLDTRPLRPGQRVEVRGRVLGRNSLDGTEARVVGDGP